MPVKEGYCPATNTKIGYKTANGILRMDWTKARQVAMKYDVIDSDGVTILGNTTVHLVVCKDVAERMEADDITAIEAALDNVQEFMDLKEAYPDTTFISFEDETPAIPGIVAGA